MKITAVKPFPIKADRPYLFVKVETDEGVYGIGVNRQRKWHRFRA